MKKYKWLECRCSECNCLLPPVRGKEGETEPIKRMCWDCVHPEETEARARMWQEADRKILEMAARGEILDAEGNPVPAISVTQFGGGRYETHKYVMGLFGLEEVKP